MVDVLFSVPWQCGDNDCKADGGWHKGTYWIEGRGYTYDAFSDGDHEKCWKRDLPTADEVVEAWREYSEYVLRTGLDPLSEFMVKHETKKVRKYFATFTDSIGGLLLVKVRTAGGKKVPLDQMPDELETYLNVESKGRNYYQRDFAKVDECRTLSGAKVRRIHGREDVTFDCEVEFRIPRTPALVRSELRAAARRHLAHG